MRSRFFRPPSYRRHKPTDKAVVTIEGRDIYLGPYGTVESRSEYERLLGEWLTARRNTPQSISGSDLTVNELFIAYHEHAARYYLKDGKQTSEVRNIGLALRQARRLYGHTLVSQFGPLALKAVRQSMVESGICRNEVNKRIRHVIRAFKWGVEEEMVSTSVYPLKAVAGLRRGRSDARETAPVKPVPEALIGAVRPFVSRQVWAMIEIQSLTGMRPGEVCIVSCALAITT